MRSNKNSKNDSDKKQGLNRRSFVKLLPAIGTAGMALPYIKIAPVEAQTPAATPPPQQQNQPPLRVTQEMLKGAEGLMGVELNDAQEKMALRGVNGNLGSYEAIRKINIPLDTEPATAFHPGLPGKKYGKTRAVAPKAAPGRTRAAKAAVPDYSSIEEVAFFSAAQLGELVRTKQISSTELTKMYLARLKRYSPKLLCVITLTEELALKQAAAADAEIKRGQYRGPLHGIPWGAKDLFATKGIPTTWGAEPYKNQIIDYDATVVERLDKAGAVLVAKLSMGALAQGGLWFAGMTKNPWKTDETSSGSSAGPASATSAGLVGFSIGTETLGSIMSPSSTCGVTGLRPTYGRISRYGAMGLSWTMDKIGPICRSAEDCALALKATYGPDERDRTVEAVPFDWSPGTDISKLRIGYLKTEFENTRIPEPRRAIYKDALSAFESAGAKMVPIELPQFDFGSLRIILSAEAAAAFDDLTRSGGVNELSGQAPQDWPNQFRTARFIPAVEYIRAQRARTLLIKEMDKLMSQWDLFVSPAPGSASLTLTNLTGNPAICVPCGFVDGRPLAIMFTGGLYDEAAPVAAAHAFQQATKWHTMHPKVDWA